jgi:energy-coupling factor transporter ATP-binding protein EcfA2
MPPILEVKDLHVRFPVFGGVLLRRTGEVHAVKGVSFELNHGETLGLVGESGSGKTTVGRAIINILSAMSPEVEISGQILYHHASGVVDLAPLADTLVALTRDQLLWRNPRSLEWTLGPNLSGLLGRLRRFVADGTGFWVAGDRGVGFARLGTPPLRPLREGDLPGAANDLAVDEDFLWVATDGGLVRFRLNVIRP